MIERPNWDEYFMEIMEIVSKRSTCDRGKSGCVIVKDKQILVTGYAGSPSGLPHCDDVGHLMKKVQHDDGRVTEHCMRTIHAEQNAICQAAKRGISLDGGTLYLKATPCRVCSMMVISSGIKKVICQKKYHDSKDSEEFFKQSGVELVYLSEEILKYENNTK